MWSSLCTVAMKNWLMFSQWASGRTMIWVNGSLICLQTEDATFSSLFLVDGGVRPLRHGDAWATDRRRLGTPPWSSSFAPLPTYGWLWTNFSFWWKQFDTASCWGDGSLLSDADAGSGPHPREPVTLVLSVHTLPDHPGAQRRLWRTGTAR